MKTMKIHQDKQVDHQQQQHEHDDDQQEEQHQQNDHDNKQEEQQTISILTSFLSCLLIRRQLMHFGGRTSMWECLWTLLEDPPSEGASTCGL